MHCLTRFVLTDSIPQEHEKIVSVPPMPRYPWQRGRDTGYDMGKKQKIQTDSDDSDSERTMRHSAKNERRKAAAQQFMEEQIRSPDEGGGSPSVRPR